MANSSIAVDSVRSGGELGDGSGDCDGAREIMLFGVRVIVDSMRKSVSMNNLSQYEFSQEVSDNKIKSRDGKIEVAVGYASAGDVPNSDGNRERERKRGVPWTEDEHKLFLLGLQKVGKGDWRGISRNFVKTRTPTQVASHAQKYFLRQTNLNRRRRRSSLFDITTETIKPVPMEEEEAQAHIFPLTESCGSIGFSVYPTFTQAVGPGTISLPIETPMEKLTLGGRNQESDVNSKSSALHHSALSLNLSLPSELNDSSSIHSSFPGMSSFNNGDNIITVA